MHIAPILGDPLITPKLVDVNRATKSGAITHVGSCMFLGRQLRPRPKGSRDPKTFLAPPTGAHTVCEKRRQPNLAWRSNSINEGNIFTRSTTNAEVRSVYGS